jgi:hypothetical protein
MLGRQGHRAASEVATEDGLTGLGRPHGQGGSVADEVGADRAGENQGRGERRCWQTGSSRLLERCARHWVSQVAENRRPRSYALQLHAA